LFAFSDEDTSVEALVMRWLQSQDEEDRDLLGGWIKDYFYDALKWILEQVVSIDINHINVEASTWI